MAEAKGRPSTASKSCTNKKSLGVENWETIHTSKLGLGRMVPKHAVCQTIAPNTPDTCKLNLNTTFQLYNDDVDYLEYDDLVERSSFVGALVKVI